MLDAFRNLNCALERAELLKFWQKKKRARKRRRAGLGGEETAALIVTFRSFSNFGGFCWLNLPHMFISDCFSHRTKMSLSSILRADDIDSAIAACQGKSLCVFAIWL